MSIQASISDTLSPGAPTVVHGNRVTLQAPADVRLGLAADDILGYDKVGDDLLLMLADGSQYHVIDFFRIGPQGNESRLLTATDELLVTGMMVPEPDYPAAGPPPGDAGAGLPMAAGQPGAEHRSPTGDTEGVFGAAEGVLTQLAGTALMLGSAAVYFSEPNEVGQTSQSSDAQADAPQEIADPAAADDALSDLLPLARGSAIDAVADGETPALGGPHAPTPGLFGRTDFGAVPVDPGGLSQAGHLLSELDEETMT